MWYHDDWQYRIKVTVLAEKVADDLTDFPVFVDLSLMPEDFWSNVNNGGGDIRVTKADSETELPREVVSCDTDNETGELHFLADTISDSSDTEFYIYYGNQGANDYVDDDMYGTEAVWTNGWGAVWHLSESGNTIKDSTGNGNTGTNNGMWTADGRMGTARESDGSTNYYNISINPISSDITFSHNSDMTISAWVKPNSWSGRSEIIGSRRADALGVAVLSNGTIEGQFDDIFPTSTGTVSFGNWNHIVVVQNGHPTDSTASFYLNGQFDSTGSSRDQNGWGSQPYLFIGYESRSNSRLNGVVDEIRISKVARTSEWISTEYNNQSSPATFFDVGEQEDNGEDIPTQPGNIVYKSHTTAQSTTNTLSIDYPDCNAGDLLIAIIGHDYAKTATTSVPSGWATLIEEANNSVFYGDIRAYYKIATGSETGSATWVFNDSPNNDYVKGSIIVFSGVDVQNPINAYASASDTSINNDAIAPSVTTTVDNCLILRGYSIRHPGGTYTFNQTKIFALESGRPLLGAEYSIQASAGATGSETASNTSEYRDATLTIAIAPAMITPPYVQTASSTVNNPTTVVQKDINALSASASEIVPQLSIDGTFEANVLSVVSSVINPVVVIDELVEVVAQSATSAIVDPVTEVRITSGEITAQSQVVAPGVLISDSVSATVVETQSSIVEPTIRILHEDTALEATASEINPDKQVLKEIDVESASAVVNEPTIFAGDTISPAPQTAGAGVVEPIVKIDIDITALSSQSITTDTIPANSVLADALDTNSNAIEADISIVKPIDTVVSNSILNDPNIEGTSSVTLQPDVISASSQAQGVNKLIDVFPDSQNSTSSVEAPSLSVLFGAGVLSATSADQDIEKIVTAIVSSITLTSVLNAPTPVEDLDRTVEVDTLELSGIVSDITKRVLIDIDTLSSQTTIEDVLTSIQHNAQALSLQSDVISPTVLSEINTTLNIVTQELGAEVNDPVSRVLKSVGVLESGAQELEPNTLVAKIIGASILSANVINPTIAELTETFIANVLEAQAVVNAPLINYSRLEKITVEDKDKGVAVEQKSRGVSVSDTGTVSVVAEKKGSVAVTQKKNSVGVKLIKSGVSSEVKKSGVSVSKATDSIGIEGKQPQITTNQKRDTIEVEEDGISARVQ